MFRGMHAVTVSGHRYAPRSVTDERYAAILPEGRDRPPEIPQEIFDAALAVFLEPRRLDMRALAGDLGVARATLYRRVGSRDFLLGEVVWYLTRHAIMRALEQAEGLSGTERVVAVVEGLMTFVKAQPALQRFLEQEPEAALRIMTSKDGRIQSGIIDALERLMAEEETSADMKLGIDRATLAYVIVRIGESFLYADVIADNPPDVPAAVAVVSRLLSVDPPSAARRRRGSGAAGPASRR